MKITNEFHLAAAARRRFGGPAVAWASLLISLALTTAATPGADIGAGGPAAHGMQSLGLSGLGGLWVLGMIGVLGWGEDPNIPKESFPDAARNEAELSALCEHAPIIMLLLDDRQRVKRSNRAAAIAFGDSTTDTLTGKTVMHGSRR